MHVGKPSDQWLLTSHTHGGNSFEMSRLVRLGIMVYLQNTKTCSFTLVNSVCLLRIFVRGPYCWIALKDLENSSKYIPYLQRNSTDNTWTCWVQAILVGHEVTLPRGAILYSQQSLHNVHTPTWFCQFWQSYLILTNFIVVSNFDISMIWYIELTSCSI